MKSYLILASVLLFANCSARCYNDYVLRTEKYDKMDEAALLEEMKRIKKDYEDLRKANGK
ncbi:MAG: hypothetical protein IPL26_10080 [Leptospiraceae bacterium]|nr:hypothetical protein [Leptospiraceae bacterium]